MLRKASAIGAFLIDRCITLVAITMQLTEIGSCVGWLKFGLEAYEEIC